MILGFSGGAPYYPYKGDLMGFFYFKKIYSLLPNAISALKTNDIIEIPKFKPLELNRVNGLLFAGQSYDYLMRDNDYLKLCLKAASLSKELGYNELFYKPHPLERNRGGMKIFEELGFKILEDRRPVEEIFLTEQLACVVSYNSSCLIHLKLLFGDDVRCVSYLNKVVSQYCNVKNAAVEMERIFNLCGVEYYE